MLLHGERTGVERNSEDLDLGYYPRPYSADGESEELSDNLDSMRQCATFGREVSALTPPTMIEG